MKTNRASETTHELGNSTLYCARSAGMVVMLALAFSSPTRADAILSDSITLNIKNINGANADNPSTVTVNIPEPPRFGEGKTIIDLSQATGFTGKLGYILLCEPPFNPLGGCGPKNDFKGVSDILVRGTSTAGGGKSVPAFLFFSDPFDATMLLKSLFNVTDISKVPNPLGSINGILETGKPQEVGDIFGFKDKKAVIVTSDLDTPEPGSIVLLATGLAVIAFLLLRKKTSSPGVSAAA